MCARLDVWLRSWWSWTRLFVCHRSQQDSGIFAVRLHLSATHRGARRRHRAGHRAVAGAVTGLVVMLGLGRTTVSADATGERSSGVGDPGVAVALSPQTSLVSASDPVGAARSQRGSQGTAQCSRRSGAYPSRGRSPCARAERQACVASRNSPGPSAKRPTTGSVRVPRPCPSWCSPDTRRRATRTKPGVSA